MKNVMSNKVVLSVLSLVLIVAMALSFSACGNDGNEKDDAKVETSSTIKGVDDDAKVETSSTIKGVDDDAKAKTSFTFKVVDLDGSEKSFGIKTDAKTVGEALVKEGLVSGTKGDYGLMVDTVDGVKYDYNADGAYWAFYINGEYAMSGVDSTDIVDGATYSFVATKA